MLTKDDLQQLRQVIREEVEVEADKTRKNGAKERLEIIFGLNKIEDRIKDVEISNTRLQKGQEDLQAGQKSLQESQNRIEMILNREIIGISKMISQILQTVSNQHNEHEERITRMENHLDLPQIH